MAAGRLPPIAYGKSGNKWIAIPVCYTGVLMNYRISSLNKAGFAKFPQTTDEFLAYAKAIKADGTPGGFALGHASGDANAWVYWCLWAFGGNLVDRNDKVIVNSPGNRESAEFRQTALRSHDPGRRRLERRLQQQGVSGRRNPLDRQRRCRSTPAPRPARTPNVKAIADDMDHAYWPIGPVGKPTELHTDVSDSWR